MRPLPCLPLALLATFVPALARAQATAPTDPIATARPSFSDTPQIVPVGSLQLEAGLSHYRRGEQETARWNFGEATLRYGLAPRAELRLGIPNEIVAQGHSGYGDLSLAASFYLGRLGGWDVGVIPGIEFPTGSREYREDDATPSALLNVARSFGADSLGGTVGATFGRETTGTSASVVYVHPLAASLVGFAEYAGTFDRLDQPEHYAHFGLQLIVHKTSQFDVHVAFGLSPAASHEIVGAGYSIRF